MLDEYRKGWALRYIREAEDELKASQSSSSSISLILDAARKAQAAIYFSLGDPVSLESLIHNANDNTEPVENPVLRCLVEVERSLRRIESLPDSASQEAYRFASEVLGIASGIVDVVISGD